MTTGSEMHENFVHMMQATWSLHEGLSTMATAAKMVYESMRAFEADYSISSSSSSSAAARVQPTGPPTAVKANTPKRHKSRSRSRGNARR